MTAVFRADRASFHYAGANHAAVADVSLTVEPGECCAIIGPNGSGKSTLLKLLLGVLRPSSGRVEFLGQDAAAWNRREIARRIGVVPQLEELLFPFTVRELVAMGRYPHLGAWQRERVEDRRAIEDALRRCDLTNDADRSFFDLSGGERQRARVARALAQEPDVLVLDEPSAALDLGHEMAAFEFLDTLRQTNGVTVVLATHNVNLAARFASRLLLLDTGRAVAEAAPREVLTQERVAAVYGWPVRIVDHPGPGADAGAPQIIALTTEAAATRAARPSNLEKS